MSATFPDTLAAVRHLVAATLGLDPERDVVKWLPEDLFDRVEAGEVVAQVQPLPSNGDLSEPWERVDRIQVDAYALGSTAAGDVAAALGVLNGPAYVGEVVLDDVVPEIHPHEAPFQHDAVRLVTATLRVVSRAQ